MTSTTAVIVAYDESLEEIEGLVESLQALSRGPDEIIVVDNGGPGGFAAQLAGREPAVRTLLIERNRGYGPAVNLAAREAQGEFLLLLNPDARPADDCLELLEQVASADPRIALAGAQILLEDGVTCNAGHNPLHPTGISPSGGYGRPREHGPPRDVMVVSGACCLVRRAAFLELGGFNDDFFLYYEDTNLAWRARIAGWRVVYCPQAVVLHGYEFARRGRKWFYLERNRLFSVLTNYEPATLALLAPLLLATELGLLLVAGAQGWLREKLEAYAGLIELRGALRASRRAVRRSRQRSDRELLALIDDRLDSALMPRAGALLANIFCLPYMALVRRLLR